MSVESTQAVMEHYAKALLSGGDFARYLTLDVLWTTVDTGERVQGREQVAQFIRDLHSRIFDAKVELKNLIIADHNAVAEARFTGRQVGEFQGIPPTGREVSAPYCVVYDVSETGITALRAYGLVALLVRQLGQAEVPA